MQLKFLVVDDEKNSRDYIRDLVLEFEPNALIVETGSPVVAARYINELRPDILFLDIQMPELDAFGVLGQAEQRDFELVFITAYSQYAIKAIKEGACDYLLKPVKKSEFREMLEKVVAKRRQKIQAADETGSLPADQYLDNKLNINHQQGIRFVTLRDIVFLEASNTYTTLHMCDKEKIITTRPIHRFEKSLDPKWFFRIHKSFIIGLHHFKEYSSKDGNAVIMTNGHKLQLSRYRLSAFLKILRDIPVKQEQNKTI